MTLSMMRQAFNGAEYRREEDHKQRTYISQL